MEHTVTFKVHIPGQGPKKGQRLHFAVCSCRTESMYETERENLYRWVIVHLMAFGVIKSEVPEDLNV